MILLDLLNLMFFFMQIFDIPEIMDNHDCQYKLHKVILH